MKTIWKFRFEMVSPLRISMPKGAHAGCLWAIVEPENELESRYFEIFGTGQFIYEDVAVQRKYVATFQQPPFVWHVFERL